MKHFIMAAMLIIALAAAEPSWAGPENRSLNPGGACCAPPRFQIFEAPKPYGGLIMVDTQTGQSWQRIKINTPAGIRVRWLKVPMIEDLPQGQVILWD
ncbi:hypothetical protein [Desulfarculus baarsii]